MKDIRDAVARAEATLAQSGRPTILFVDEVHRFNKAQQDAFLPYVEHGTVTFIGATTENPSFEVIGALLSRAAVYVLEPLSPTDLAMLLDRAVPSPRRARARPARARCACSRTPTATAAASSTSSSSSPWRPTRRSAASVDLAFVEATIARSLRRFDKGGEAFYDQISALHKAVRGSDPDASLYWMCRMLDGGADPLYVVRRMIRMATEDIGLADPRALQIALDAAETYERLGSPEGELALAECVLYLAVAPKSNAAYVAYGAARAFIKRGRLAAGADAPAQRADQAHEEPRATASGYRYAHDEADAYAAGETYLPDDMTPQPFYTPTDRGLEARIREKLAQLRARDRHAGLSHPRLLRSGVSRRPHPPATDRASRTD